MTSVREGHEEPPPVRSWLTCVYRRRLRWVSSTGSIIASRCRVFAIRPYSVNAAPSGVGRPSRASIRSHVVGTDLVGHQRTGQAQHVRPVLHDPGEVHLVPGDRIQRAVVGGGVGGPFRPPVPGVADVGEPRGEPVPNIRKTPNTISEYAASSVATRSGFGPASGSAARPGCAGCPVASRTPPARRCR